MEHLKMQTANKADENFAKLARLFPNAVTETIDANGQVVRAIDKDVLVQEINGEVVEGPEERYQFTWPDKKEAIRLANAPTTKTLRPVRSDETTPTGADSKGEAYTSTAGVDFDDTENLYIEGDNLEVLKLLQETYLGKIKMIYIDPPYNTGNDFVYNDEFDMERGDYLDQSGQLNEQGQRLVKNLETNGRFHTDWLNMIYPRLKLAKDLLSNDGVIFISIDDNEVENLKKVCNEVFGNHNFIACISWKARGGRQDSKFFAELHEYILCYVNGADICTAGEEVPLAGKYPKFDSHQQRYYKTQLLRKWGSNSKRADRPNLFYAIKAPDGSDVYPLIFDKQKDNEITEGRWRHGPKTMERNIQSGLVEFMQNDDGYWIAYEKIYQPLEGEEKTKKFTTWIDESNDGSKTFKDLFSDSIFDYPKSIGVLLQLLRMANLASDSLILDFFSGSATTAHAVMQLNAEDGGRRKFIMVQLPEVTDEKSAAHKAGYQNICEIGKERIRRAAKKVAEEHPEASFDGGFRVLKLDSSNMKDVYYEPEAYSAELFAEDEDNIKEDRTPEDLLFQVMLDLGVLLSSKIEVREIAGKRVFYVADGFLVACFDTDITDEVIIAIAKEQPYYFVMRDRSMANDSVATNFEQIFSTYSPDTVRRVL